ncbi:deoxyribonuclease IV [Tundrisphaera lichenicola]|uniref:deoxyribonuclease IV n=1 Tax=Tundrisphaera lichenicola TaxID=2029860 RepID=UPI003EB976BC
MRAKFGSHMSMAGGHDRAVRSAHAVGFSTVQVFTKSNNQWRAAALTDAHVSAFRAALAETGVSEPIAHASYLINLASPDDALWEKSIASTALEIERGEALGIGDLVMHPGAHVGQGEEAGLGRIARGLDEVHRRTRGVALKIALETTAGQGTCLGHRFEHIGRLLEMVEEPERLGVCVDTCHIFAAGYPLGTDTEYHDTMAELDRAIGTEQVRVWHLNDSLKPQGSRVDRHAGIGRGHIGIEPFRRLVNDPRFRHLPMILETPKGEEEGEDLDAVNLRLLRGLEAASAVSA